MVQKSRSPHSLGSWPPSEEYLDQTIEVWQLHSRRTLTREDAAEIAENVLGFFRVLEEWAREDLEQRSSPKQDRCREYGSSPVGVEICPFESKCKFAALRTGAELGVCSVSACER